MAGRVAVWMAGGGADGRTGSAQPVSASGRPGGETSLLSLARSLSIFRERAHNKAELVSDPRHHLITAPSQTAPADYRAT